MKTLDLARTQHRPLLWLLLATLTLPACGKSSDTRAPAPPPPLTAVDNSVPPPAAATEASAGEQAKPKKDDEPHPLFDSKLLVDVQITLNATARASLRREPRKWTRATVTVSGHQLANVGVRLKGHRSMRDLNERPAFLLDFRRYAKGRKLHGLRKLALNNLVEDPTLVRETLGYELFRQAGVPAPRTAYVHLSVDNAPPRLYLAVEPLDKRFCKRNFSDGRGNLYEGEYGCDVNLHDVWGFDMDAGKDRGRSDLQAFAKLMPKGVNAVFGDQPGGVDRDRVLSFLAMSVVLGDFDGYEHHHNYYLYHDPKVDRWSLMPWGIDRSFYKALEPFSSEGLLARMCFDDRQCRLDYVGKLHRAIDLLEAMNVPTQIKVLDARIAAAKLPEGALPETSEERAAKRAELLTFVRGRRKQLARVLRCVKDGKEQDFDKDGYGCMDCDDDDPKIHPDAAEVCDGKDNDCSGLADDSPKCPCTPVEAAGVKFELCDLPMPWGQAARFCRDKGMTLARIDSKVQSKTLYRQAKKVRRTRWWIGLNDRIAEDDHKWADGAPVTFTYWKSGEPSDNACGEDCAAIAKRARGRWYDSHCGLRRAFICRAPGGSTHKRKGRK